MVTIQEILETPVLGSYDVIVCGGGIAGSAAAVAASRSGASVLLIEKGIMLGGLATQGLISWYEPICDGEGNKFCCGMAEELLRLALRYGPDTLPSEWQGYPGKADSRARCSAHFSPALFAMALDEWLKESGADILFDTLAVKPVMEELRCRGIIVENKTGRGFYAAKAVVDATGDLDIMHRAGAEDVLGQNYLTYIGYYTDEAQCASALAAGNMIHARKWLNAGSDLWGNGHPVGKELIAGVTAEEVTDFVLTGRRLLLENVRGESRMARDITALPSMAQLRKTRRLIGAYELTEDDKGRHFDDSIAVASDFCHRRCLYEIPFRVLYSPLFDNIITAGRSISSSGWAWDVVRVIPAAVATGQAAGVASARCACAKTSLQSLDVQALQEALTVSGARIWLDR